MSDGFRPANAPELVNKNTGRPPKSKQSSAVTNVAMLEKNGNDTGGSFSYNSGTSIIDRFT